VGATPHFEPCPMMKTRQLPLRRQFLPFSFARQKNGVSQEKIQEPSCEVLKI
jgi:hypothetical protein